MFDAIFERASRPHWEEDADCSACNACGEGFCVYRRRHHCRLCGLIFCRKCSNQKVVLPQVVFDQRRRQQMPSGVVTLEYSSAQRVCQSCAYTVDSQLHATDLCNRPLWVGEAFYVREKQSRRTIEDLQWRDLQHVIWKFAFFSPERPTRYLPALRERLVTKPEVKAGLTHDARRAVKSVVAAWGKYSPASDEVAVHAMALFERLLAREPASLRGAGAGSAAVAWAFLACLMISTKLLTEGDFPDWLEPLAGHTRALPVSASIFALIGSCTVEKVNRVERWALKALDWHVAVDPAVHFAFKQSIDDQLQHAARGFQFAWARHKRSRFSRVQSEASTWSLSSAASEGRRTPVPLSEPCRC
ncbi:putative phosphatidylinositol kinase L615 [Diplonema papillatum]|nr:putative phosphatidylinositol kinase L615 [Diplonema papillatum]|eukprot:gene19179-29527_t